MAFLSYRTHSFWPSSSYARPFLSDIAILGGDLIAIPVFNYYLFALLWINRNELRQNKGIFIFNFILLLVANSAVAYAVHRVWTHDQYMGFMDLTAGTLSLAGWWHFCFSTLEAALVFFFLFLWFVFSRKNNGTFRFGLLGWRALVAYFVVVMLDLLCERGFTADLQLGWFRIVGFLTAVAILVLANRFKSAWKLEFARQKIS